MANSKIFDGGSALLLSVALAGQVGPQVLIPEEIITVPAAFTLGMKAGNAKTNMEIEGGNAYLEMLNNGVSEETARVIATGVGGINALLETAQLDELLKAYQVLDKAGADDAEHMYSSEVFTNQGINDSAVAIPEEANKIAKQFQENNGTPPKGYKGGRTYNIFLHCAV